MRDTLYILSEGYLERFAVIQELMQTDLHRVIRTQQLTDDHCQVRLAPQRYPS